MQRQTRCVLWLLLFSCATASAEDIPIPNFSFESPAVLRNEQNPYGALPYLDDWDETAVGLADEYDQNTGVFLNTPPGSYDHIVNAHLDRLAFVSSLIGNDLRQMLTTTFTAERQYRLTVGVAGSANYVVGAGEKLQIALFYVDTNNVEQVLASALIDGAEVGSTYLSDLTVQTALVAPTDACVGKPIGVLIRPWPNDPDDADGEGMWDVDNVRLASEALVGDFDNDLDVDHTDLQFLLDCSTGPALGPPAAGCGNADLDGDDDVDQADFGILQRSRTVAD